jgi:hypothetical protein
MLSVNHCAKNMKSKLERDAFIAPCRAKRPVTSPMGFPGPAYGTSTGRLPVYSGAAGRR